MLLSGDAKDMKSGVQMARDLLRSGAAATKLAELQGAVYDT
jgi:anthranilate phosphoribosyltransferase